LLKNLKMRELPAQHTKFLYILPIFSIDRFILYQIYFTFVIEENMKKIFFLFLSTFLTLTIIFCGDEKFVVMKRRSLLQLPQLQMTTQPPPTTPFGRDDKP